MTFIEFLLLGVGVGSAYAIASLGIVVIYQGSRVINFAQTGLVAVGAYTFYGLVHAGLSKPSACVIALVSSSALGALIHMMVMRPLRSATELIRLVAILGVYTVIINGVILVAGDNAKESPSILPSTYWHLGSHVTIGSDRIYVFAIALVLTILLELVSRFTLYGVFTRAVAENESQVRGLGYSSDLISLTTWMLGGALGGLAGILLASSIGLSTTEMETLLLPALAAALVGRFESLPLTFLAALGIGVVESEMNNYFPSAGIGDVIALLAVIGVLLLRGTRLPSRDVTAARLPSVGTGTAPLGAAVAGLLGIVLVLAVVPIAWQSAISTTAATGLVFLSIVVLTGYAGQISLSQMAVAGLGALVAGKLSGSAGIPLLLIFPIAIVIMLPISLIVALPAFRARGMYLAIATLGLGYIINEAILNNPAVTGGASPVTTRSPEVFGYSVDPILYPYRYAVFSVVVFGLGMVATTCLRRSYVARRWLSVRTNERASAGSGISVGMAKTSAICASATLAAAGGVLFAFSGPILQFTGYNTDASINAVVLLAIGGVGYISGSIVGALAASGCLIAYLVSDYTSFSYAVVGLVGGATVIANVILAPSGVIDLNIRQFRRWRPKSSVRARLEVSHGGHGDARWAERAPGKAMDALSVDAVSASFGSVVALRNVSLQVTRGEVLGLIGPNGAGKTTLLDVMTGFSEGTGSIYLGSERVNGWSPDRLARAGLAWTFQAIELFEDLPVGENLLVASEAGHSPGRTFRPHLRKGAVRLPPICVEALEAFGLEQCLDRRPGELSYGQRSLVGVCRALALDPKFLLLDEPAAGLSSSERTLLQDFLRSAASRFGVGMVLVEHDVALVLAVCDRVVALNLGEVIADGAPREVRDDDGVRASYLGVSGEEVAATTGQREASK